MKTILRAIFLTATVGSCAFGQSLVIWNESVDGPLSNDSSFPTPLVVLQPGTNSVLGMTENEPATGNHIVYPDLFVIQVPDNSAMTALYLELDKPNLWNWIGDTSYSTQLGFIQSPRNGDVLAQWGLELVGSGYYGMYVANLDSQVTTSIATYRLDFVVQAVPEPSAVSLLLAGAGIVALNRSRKPRSS